MTLVNSNIKNSDALPRVALIADVQNWAFHNISKQICKYLSDSYDFKIFFYGEYEEIEDLMLEVKDYDLIHFFWRDALYSFLSPWVRHSFAKKNWDYFDFITNTIANANITMSASEHLLLKEDEIKERVILYNALAIGYTTFSEKLNKILSSIPEYPPPDGNTEDGVDLDFFVPVNPERLYKPKNEIVIGWVGNSKWGESNGIDHKGVKTIIEPVIESLKAEGCNIRKYFADRHERWIPHSEMNDYYNSIDIYVCASDIEGTPNPALESMACGIPVISTDVGIIPQLFGEKQKQYILPERSIEALKEKLKELIESPEKRKELSKENLKEIKKWSWEKRCQKWDDFFKAMLTTSRNEAIKKRRDFLRRQALEKHLFSGIEQNLVVSAEQTINVIAELSSENKNGEALQYQYYELKEFNEHLQLKISLMEQSKFWKIRNAWFKMKGLIKK
jgi:glycosyltransferase involved in cell wall biosynthesis